ncbi:hypothetical protein ACFU7D_01420 [Nocardioides sp. NPDC057577]|uniref:hypothetical protein n=1 Tax=Nocardioides sp. NPDC057577 TaxID=3346171 RepID=UPI00366B7D77
MWLFLGGEAVFGCERSQIGLEVYKGEPARVFTVREKVTPRCEDTMPQCAGHQ